MKREIVALFLISSSIFAREIVPGVVSFDEPAGLTGFGPHHDPGDSPFDLSSTLVSYQPGMDLKHSFRQFDIGIAVVGYQIGEGKRITFRTLDENQLKKELLRGSSEDSVFGDSIISGHPAYCIAGSRKAPDLRAGAVIYTEFYYVPFEPNRGISIRLVADSVQGLQFLQQYLTLVRIPKDPHLIAPTPTPKPSAELQKKERITRNLRLVMGAGEQCQLRHGVNRFTMEELKKDFGRELSSLPSVDGEVYDDLIWMDGQPLRVSTRSLGTMSVDP